MILGDTAGKDSTAAMLCTEVGAVVVSVEYRRAPEHPQRTSAGRDRLPVWATGGVSGAGQVREALRRRR
jgi:hypothetical protein